MSRKNALKATLSLLLTLTFSPLLASNSLMFSKKEQSAILLKRAQDMLHNLKNKGDCLECEGIIFQGPDQWSAWINGQKVDSTCPECPQQHLKVSAVDSNKMHLEWHHKGKKHLVILGPNQYYNATLSKTISTNENP